MDSPPSSPPLSATGDTPAVAPDRLTFIGGGHLAQAFVDGIYASFSTTGNNSNSNNLWKHSTTINNKKPCPITITARRPEHLRQLQTKYPLAHVTLDNLDPLIWETPEDVETYHHVLFICTLPIDVPSVCRQIAPAIATISPSTARPTIVTMCPGISVAQLQSWLPAGTPIVRSMPNLPVTVREGATGLFPCENARGQRTEVVRDVVRLVSPAAVVLGREEELDIVAAISGSAPAHFYFLIESLVAAAEAHGLDSETARELVVQSCLGSGMLSKRDCDRPVSVLRKEVCVPGGSTEKAINHMMEGGFPRLVGEAVTRSLRANREMSRVERD
ncbi:hypothetical protein SMACR_03729 [Sordaria macrospora]|uniref:WGS project CABT00000000 data, contig 2.16 n=2 Tax=Sordaria macrospora TaxID=5147 RepID=F7VZS4_SORMK|nr:uncharacterized protein SMAC_03729 [Sordaria macrospora k-hell]KAA8629208.1 hypothetical protein SMACR_03729 [Sordaria macrospora]WPJ61634.1 hypothetical protein SMAC4_03729 [Sordaria macrospora]CCC11023.1 unnamed protein product [Sordaria macrospora k-hell]